METYKTQVVSHASCDTGNAAAVARALEGVTAQVKSNFSETQRRRGADVVALGCAIENFAVVPDGVVATLVVSYRYTRGDYLYE